MDETCVKRLNKVRKAMELKAWDAMVVFSPPRGKENMKVADVKYLANFGPATRQNALIIPKDGEPILLIPLLISKFRAEETSWVKDIRVGGGTDAEFAKTTNDALRDIGVDAGKLGLTPLEHFPVWYYESIRTGFPKVKLESATRILNEMRMIKDDYEQECARRAAGLLDTAWKTLYENAKEGVAEYEVAAKMEYAVRILGPECVLDTNSFYSGDPRKNLAHRAATDKIIKKGDSILSAPTSTYNCYYANANRTFFVGQPGKDIKRLLDIHLDGLKAMLDAVKPGNKVIDAKNAFLRVIKKDGYGKEHINWRMGHGVGLEYPEHPIFDIPEDEQMEFRPGMTISVHPNLHVDGIGRTLLGDSVLVTKSGPEILTKFDRSPI